MLDAYREIIEIVADSAFPCLFGRKALKDRGIKFLFVSEALAAQDWVEGVLHYTRFIRDVPVRQRLYCPLVAVFENSAQRTIVEEHAYCWKQLQILHDADPCHWLDSIPLDAEDSGWTFCFDGVELFVNMSCPHHERMKSRHLGGRIAFVINPRKNFDVIANIKSEKGIRIRQRIRERVGAYNDGVLSEELGFFGDANNLEWKQYQLNEPGEPSLARCPLLLGGQ